MNFKIVANWRAVLVHAWSIRLIILAGVFSALEVVFAVFADNPPIPRGAFAGLSGSVSLAAFYFRFVSQKELRE